MWELLRFIKSRLVWVLPLAMISGLILGSLVNVNFLKHAIMPLTIFMVLPMMINLDWRTLISRDSGRGFLPVLALNIVIIPILAYLIGRIAFPGDSAALTAMILIGVLPTSGMTISWTGFAGGNVRAAVRNVMAGLILGAILLPLFLKLFLGEASTIPGARIFRQIGLVLAVPMFIGGFTGWALRRQFGSKEYNARFKPRMAPLSSAAVVLMVFSAMALKARSILAEPSSIFRSLFALLVFYIVAFFIAHLVGRLSHRKEDAVALVFSTAIRNLSIALALSLFLLGTDSASASLLTSLAFIIQVQAAAWYVKIQSRRDGGKARKGNRYIGDGIKVS